MEQRQITIAESIFGFLVFSIFFGCRLMANQAASSDFLEFRGPWGSACFSVKVADTPAKRAQGLMHVDHLPKEQGMLFVYPEPSPVSFWMKNTVISLDMIFLNAKGRIQHIHSNARPQDQTVISGGNDIQYVVEINGGLSEKLGILEGSYAHNEIISNEQILNCALTE